MNFFNQLPSIAQGVLLIIAGMIILLDTLGYATQIIHTIVLCGAIALIVWGFMAAGIAQKIYHLLKKDE